MRGANDTVIGIDAAVTALTAGRPVVLVDERAEDLGVLILSGEHITAEQMAFAVRHTSGFLTAALTGADADRLGLPPMDPDAAPDAAGYTVSIDATGGGTGISAVDRSRTVRMLADPATTWADFTRPGHVVGIRVADGGLAARSGLPEAAVELVTLAGARPVAVLGALVEDPAADDPALALPDRAALEAFAAAHDLPVVTVSELAEHLAGRWVRPAGTTTTSTDTARVTAHSFGGLRDGLTHTALVWGTPAAATPLHIHVVCPQEQLIGALQCGCRSRRDAAVRALEWSGIGVLVLVATPPAEGGRTSTWCAATADPAREDRVATAAHIVTELGLSTVTLVEAQPDLVQALVRRGVRVGPREGAPRSVVRSPRPRSSETVPTVIGTVVHGDARGRTLGFPTANLDIELDRCHLPDGVYGGLARIIPIVGSPSDFVPAAISVGSNPTFPGTEQRFEVHLLDFTGSLYGRRLEVLPLTFIRPTLPFESVEALVVQIESDVREIRRLAATAPAVARSSSDD